MCPKHRIDFPEMITIRLDAAMRKRLEEMAREEERNLGQMARLLIREAMACRDTGRRKKKPT
jgi:predicted transcriptional regulator